MSCKIKLFFLMLILMIGITTPTQSTNPNTLYTTVYGSVCTHNGTLGTLFQHPAIDHLKDIQVLGAAHYFRYYPSFTLHDHVLNMIAIMQRFNIPVNSQEYILTKCIEHSKSGHIRHYLHHINSLQTINPHSLDYHLTFGYLLNLICKQDINDILSDLVIVNEEWVFKSQMIARQFADIGLYLTCKLWGNDQIYMTNYWFEQAVTKLQQGDPHVIIDKHKLSDGEIINQLDKSHDFNVISNLFKARLPNRFYHLSKSSKASSIIIHPPFCAVDPLVQTVNGTKKLSALDPEFHKQFMDLSKRFKNGFGIMIRE